MIGRLTNHHGWKIIYEDREIPVYVTDEIRENYDFMGMQERPVNFDLVTKYVEPEDSIHCNRGADVEFAILYYSSEEIKTECERQYANIKSAEARIKKLREICQHINTHEGLYSWRVGAIDNAILCSDCGKVLKNLSIPKFETTTNNPSIKIINEKDINI